MDRLLTSIEIAGVSAPCFSADDAAAIPDATGGYLLLLRLARPVEVRLPGRDPTSLQPGWLAYAGSAKGPGGLRARLRRHLRSEKKPHWHVDQLTIHAAELAALPVAGGDECELVAALSRSPAFAMALRDFGNTDCRACQSHLMRYCG